MCSVGADGRQAVAVGAGQQHHLQIEVEVEAELGRQALAQVYASQGKPADAEKLLRELIASPTPTVTKEQATIVLGQLLASSKPDEARKLLEPLRTSTRSAVSRAAITASGAIAGGAAAGR